MEMAMKAFGFGEAERASPGEVEEQSFAERMGNAMCGVIFGILLFIAGLYVCWWNEGRYVFDECVIEKMGVEKTDIKCEYDAANDGKLVHTSCAIPTTAVNNFIQPELNYAGKGISYSVQREQWQQYEVKVKGKTTKKKVGGGTSTPITYKLEHAWRSTKGQAISTEAKSYFNKNNIKFDTSPPPDMPEAIKNTNTDVKELDVGEVTGKTFKLKGGYISTATKPAANVGNNMDCTFQEEQPGTFFKKLQRGCALSKKCIDGMKCVGDFCQTDGSKPAPTGALCTTSKKADGTASTCPTGSTATVGATCAAATCVDATDFAKDGAGNCCTKDTAPTGALCTTSKKADGTASACPTGSTATVGATCAAATCVDATDFAKDGAGNCCTKDTGRRHLAVIGDNCNLEYKNGHYVSYSGNPQNGDARYTIKVSQAYKFFNIIAQQVKGGGFEPVKFQCIGGDKAVEYKRGSDTAVTSEKLLADAAAAATMLTWVLRFVTFLMVWCGLQMCCGPCALMPDIIPVIGPFIGDLVGMLLCCATCLLGFCCWVLVFAVAWVRFRPIVGIPLLICGLLAGGGVIAWRVKAKMDEDKRGGAKGIQMS